MKGLGALSAAQRIVMFVTLGASAVLLAVSMVRQMVPGSKNALAPAVLPVSILMVLAIAMAAMFRPHQETAFLASGSQCLKNGLEFSIAAAALLWLVLWRGAILYPKLTGGVAGGLAGIAGLTVLELKCSDLNLWHILVWHGGVVAISSLGGALLGAAVEFLKGWRKPKAARAFGPAR